MLIIEINDPKIEDYFNHDANQLIAFIKKNINLIEEPVKKQRQFGQFKNQGCMSDDFDEELSSEIWNSSK